MIQADARPADKASFRLLKRIGGKLVAAEGGNDDVSALAGGTKAANPAGLGRSTAGRACCRRPEVAVVSVSPQVDQIADETGSRLSSTQFSQ
jgi:hypothetical protein